MEVLLIALVVSVLLIPIRAFAFDFGIAEIMAISAGLNQLLPGGGGGGEASALQQQIGQALMEQFRNDQAIKQPFQRDLSRAIRRRQGGNIGLNRIALPKRSNPFASAVGGVGGPQRSVSSAAPGASRIGSFLRQKAVGNRPVTPTA